MSTDLEWLLLRGGNSFVVKRVPEGPIFSKEPGNLLNLHSHKYSGLANSKTLHVFDNNSTVTIVHRKKSASRHQVKPGFATSTIRSRSGPRRATGVAASYAKRGYRPDLRTAAVARVSALLSAQKEPKPTPPKKVRGKKKNAATA
ncbi:ribosomal protein L28e [Punctularia strigosozonata HHB-11173 SS5]|uniref:ribosomal protein L28e n=1 Tax=Punctularia strigosozonata (strain HHB-11173) TaxID=741275 RepID=UPI000441769B|nr:ribosomal protein L28e [Punctularia strigosozonata HHB-11173 SS5]EIN14297.1 ribosomal protein L28e [Punctularia strigosozonata HHB-11173 SS5]